MAQPYPREKFHPYASRKQYGILKQDNGIHVYHQ